MEVKTLVKWLTPGIGIKRWLLLLALGIGLIAASAARAVLQPGWEVALLALAGALTVIAALWKFINNLLIPYRKFQQGHVIDVVYAHTMRQRGIKLVVIGGGTGLPSVLRGMKPLTSNLTAVVTVADDGGSSGRLRRELGVLPPGDLRNNIAALADDEDLMTKLFQYRFTGGELKGHAFGNLFISALTAVSGGSLERALTEIQRVLNIQGRVLPSTMEDVMLEALVRIGEARTITVRGESLIGENRLNGRIEMLRIHPAEADAYQGSIQAILEADIIVIGPGSLYTSILPNLLVRGISEAVRASSAYKVYVCNIAMQPGETSGYTVADHVLALERHVGRGLFQAVLANNHYPVDTVGVTEYVYRVPPYHEVLQRYEIHYTNLVDDLRPWRHNPTRLAEFIMSLSETERAGSGMLVQ